jgi:hypothetical protein
MESLRDAINDLYVAFSPYQLREAISFCDHCHSPDDDQLLRSKKLRELGINELHQYIWDAMLVWGDEYDFKHFLPRILEILALEERLTNEFVDPEMVLGRLSYGNWTKWTARAGGCKEIPFGALVIKTESRIPARRILASSDRRMAVCRSTSRRSSRAIFSFVGVGTFPHGALQFGTPYCYRAKRIGRETTH